MMTQDDEAPPLIPLDGEQATEALTRLARHVPPDVLIGRPLAAVFDPDESVVRFLTSVGLFESFSAHAERLVSIGKAGDEMAEITTWCGGRETGRYIHRTSDLRS